MFDHCSQPRYPFFPMKQIVMDRENPFLHEEIIRKILARLPVKSLIRFHCVCKDWKNLIKSPSFVEEHLHSSQQNPCLVFDSYETDYPLQSYLPDRQMQVGGVQTTPADPNGGWTGTIICSSNGLLCVQCKDATHSIKLWNPAIREMRLVPRSPYRPVYQRETKSIGFGFSSIVNDYKIVRINLLPDGSVNHVEVYSLSTGVWKKVEFGNLDGATVTFDGKSFNGVIYWFGFKLIEEDEDENGDYLLISYDIATEVFKLIPLPILAPAYHDSHRNKLSAYENKLALLSHTTIGDCESSLVDLWVMEENTSWTKKYSISHPCLLLPGTIWRNEIVCEFFVFREHITSALPPVVVDRERNIVLINLTTNEFKRYSIHKYGYGFGVLNYIESLVPVGTKYIENS